MQAIEQIDVDGVTVPSRSRPLSEDAVTQLMQSIQKIGLLTPITVRCGSDDDCPELFLVSGYHRLEACKRLGMETIDAFVAKEVSEDQARLWEIAENLHRSELTALERSEHIAEWVRLSEKVLAQVVPKPQGGRPETGIRKASRELGIERMDASRSVRVDSLTPEAKEAAREVGLDDNRSALLEASRAEPERQAARIREIAEEKAITKDDPPDMAVVAHNLGRKYTPSELQCLVDNLCEIIKARLAA